MAQDVANQRRGQVLIATAFIIAGILVLLIGISSSGLFAPATVTQPDATTTAPIDAITYGMSRDIQGALQQSFPSVADPMEGLSSADREIVRNQVSGDVIAITNQYEELHTTGDASVDITSNIDTASTGIYVSQQSVGSFTDGSHKTVATNTLEPTSAVVIIDTETIDTGDRLDITFTPINSPTRTYTIQTGETPTDGIIKSPGGSTCHFPINEQDVRIDLVQGSVADCTLPWTFESPSRQRLESIRIQNGTDIRGQFGVTVQDPGTGREFTTPIASDDSISVEPAVIELSLTVTYETPKTTYQRRLTIHPTDTLP